MPTKSSGFTLIELMIVVAIIGILASIAIPSYNDYITRSQVSEAIYLTNGTKTALADWYLNEGRWPASISSVSRISAGKYVSGVTLDTSDGVGLGVRAQMKPNGVNQNIQNGWYAIYTTNGQSWECGEEGGAAQFTNIDGVNGTKYLPPVCK